MKDFKKKIKEFCKVQSELDGYIWYVFHKYIEQKKINFSSPDNWDIGAESTSIWFGGSDGCMGCYDSKSISIPLSVFIDSENELLKLRNERSIKEKEKIRKEKAVKNQKDRREFVRLTKKFRKS